MTTTEPRRDTRRSPLVRILLLAVHRQQRTRPPHPVRRWLCALVGRDPVRFDRTAACRQCDRTDFVAVLRLGIRRARYWCGYCGAVVSLADPAGLLSARARRRPRPTPAPAAPSESPDELAGEVMPAAMYRWVSRSSRRPLTRAGLDRAAFYQLYKRWDAHLQQLDPAARAELAAPGEPPPAVGLPSISAVVGALHDLCYRTERVVASLIGASDSGEEPEAETLARVWERVEHARRWLAGRMTEQCWIVTRLVDGAPAQPDPAQVSAAVTALQQGELPDPAAARAARTALFGTDGGPSLRTLRRVYPTDQLVAALTAHLQQGGHPLRADVLAHLTAPVRPAPATLPLPERVGR